MIWRRTAAGVVLIGLALAACSGAPPAPITDRSRPDRQQPVPASYAVRKGDTLYSISWSYGLDYRQVARWNGMGPPYRIHPGQTLRLRPSTAAAAAPRPAPQARSQPRPRPVPPTRAERRPRPMPPAARSETRPRPAPGARPAPPTSAPAARPAPKASRELTWIWPTDGRVLRSFSAAEAKKGIDIGGRPGQSVRAAADGQVVYSGDGLLRYGKLIIIKHDPVYFSAYAHNRALLVREGEQVKKGQRIAEMGNTGTTQTMLHFEVRRNGTSVDPMKYLPRK